MDWCSLKERVKIQILKYRFVLLVLAVGILLMLLPNRSQPSYKDTDEEITLQEESLAESLEQILSYIEGAGKVSVLLTEKQGREVLYQVDEEKAAGEKAQDIRRRTVIVTDSSRQESGLIRQTNPPILLGAVVVCQGADRPKVKLAVMEAVMRATGLPSNCICVLKMK